MKRRNALGAAFVAAFVTLVIFGFAIALFGGSRTILTLVITNASSEPQGVRVQLISSRGTYSRLVYSSNSSNNGTVAFVIKEHDYPLEIKATAVRTNEVLIDRQYKTNDELPETIRVTVN